MTPSLQVKQWLRQYVGDCELCVCVWAYTWWTPCWGFVVGDQSVAFVCTATWTILGTLRQISLRTEHKQNKKPTKKKDNFLKISSENIRVQSG